MNVKTSFSISLSFIKNLFTVFLPLYLRSISVFLDRDEFIMISLSSPIPKPPRPNPNQVPTSFTSTNVKLRLRFDVHLTFT